MVYATVAKDERHEIAIPPSPRTYLDLNARVFERITPSQVREWSNRATKTDGVGSSLAKVWLGEWELGRCEDPYAARSYFGAACRAEKKGSPVRTLAEFDYALTLARQGRNAEAIHRLDSLRPLQSADAVTKIRISLLEHAVKYRKGVKDRNIALGAPEPVGKLDPYCGQRSLSACLTRLKGRPVEVSKVCRATGLGSNLEDLKLACNKLGVTSYLLSSSEKGFKNLPKPLVAFVDNDHFVAVLDSDRTGLDVSCSECFGGAARRVTWTQWKALQATAYLVPVCSAGFAQSEVSGALAMSSRSGFHHMKLARRQRTAAVFHAASLLAGEIHLLAENVARYLWCSGFNLASLPKDWGSAGYQGDPVDLAYHTNTVGPELDLTVKNPNGPSVTWGRRYSSIFNAADSTGVRNAQDQFNFGPNWTTPYSIYVVDPSATAVLQLPEGVGTQLSTNGGGTINPGFTWELYLNGTKVQDNTNPGGWVISTPSSTINVNPPTTLVSTVGYKLVWYWNFATWGAPFDALPVGTVRQGIPGVITPTGSNAPYTGLTWDIREGGAIIASSANPNNWNAVLGVGSAITVSSPVTASIATNYEVRIQAGGVNHSQTFSIAVGHVVQSAGSKCALMTDRSEAPFSAPSVPSASNPSVLCTSAPGTPFAAYWLYDSTDVYGDFKLVFGDGSSLLLAGVAQYQGGVAMYEPIRQFDAQGNYIIFNYDGPVTYNGLPPLANITQRNGSVLLTINRSTDPWCVINSVTDCYGRSVYYNYSGSPQLNLQSVSAIVPTGTLTSPILESYGYETADGSMESISKVSPTGSGFSTTTFTLDPVSDQIQSSVDQEGNKTLFAYTVDNAHTIVTIENSLGTVIDSYKAGFDANGSITSVTDGTQSTVIYSATYADPNDPFQPSEVQDGDSRAWFYTHDVYGHVTSSETPRGVTTNYTYSYANRPMGELTQVQEGTLPATTFTYFEPSGLLKSATGPTADGSTGTVSYTYTALGNLLTSTTPGNSVSPSIVTTLGYTTDGAYTQPEAIGEPITVTDNLGLVDHIRYDSLGRPSSSWDPLGNTATALYNLADQPTQVTVPATGQTGTGQGYALTTYLWTGGPASNTSVYDESNHLVRSQSSSYGLCDELHQTSGTSDTVTYAYDAAFRPTSITTGNLGATTYSYNAAGYLYQTVLAGGDTTTFNSYSNSGHLLQLTTPAGIVKNMTYGDPDGLLTAVSYPVFSAQNQTISYDGFGRTASVANGNATYAYTWGGADQLTQRSITFPGLTAQNLNYSYNKDGSISSLGTSAGYFTYGYDGDQRLTSVANPSTESTTYSYLNNGWLSRRTLNNNAYTVLTHNALGETSDVSNYSPSATILSEFGGLVHDGSGNLTSASATVTGSAALTGSSTFSYDALGQLLTDASTRAGGHSYSFAYDANGNPTTFRSVATTYNAKDQLNRTGYVFGADGNPTTYATESGGSDAEDRVSGFTGFNLTTYGPDGMRTTKIVGGTTTHYIYEGGVPILELNPSGTVTAINTFGPDGLISRNSGGASTFYQFDQSGSTTARLNSSGAVLDVHGVDAFGSPIVAATASDPYDGFGAQSGYYTDHETGLELLGQRYYDPKAGRFINRDPIGFGGGFNQYRYCGNSPLSRSDPSGLFDPKGYGDSVMAGVQEAKPEVNRYFADKGVLGIVGATTVNTLMDFGGGFVAGTLGMGSGLGKFAGHPAWKNAPGAALDAFALVTSVAGAGDIAAAFNAELENRLACSVGAGGCFPAGTLVQTPTGPCPIQSVKVGDIVATRNPGSGKTEFREVRQTYKHSAPELITITLSDPKTGAVVDAVTATPGHRFFVAGAGPMPLKSLGIGTDIQTRAGPPLKISSIRTKKYPSGVSVYNFEVEGDHSYFVGKASGGAWVHNAGCGNIPQELIDQAEALYPKKAGLWENHHIRPIYLGGLRNGETVALPAAYHQLITNAFRSEAAYGALEKPSEGEIQGIMEAIYKQFPIGK